MKENERNMKYNKHLMEIIAMATTIYAMESESFRIESHRIASHRNWIGSVRYVIIISIQAPRSICWYSFFVFVVVALPIFNAFSMPNSMFAFEAFHIR